MQEAALEPERLQHLIPQPLCLLFLLWLLAGWEQGIDPKGPGARSAGSTEDGHQRAPKQSQKGSPEQSSAAHQPLLLPMSRIPAWTIPEAPSLRISPLQLFLQHLYDFAFSPVHLLNIYFASGLLIHPFNKKYRNLMSLVNGNPLAYTQYNWEKGIRGIALEARLDTATLLGNAPFCG